MTGNKKKELCHCSVETHFFSRRVALKERDEDEQDDDDDEGKYKTNKN